MIETWAAMLARARSEARKFRAAEAEMAANAQRHEATEKRVTATLRKHGWLDAAEQVVAEQSDAQKVDQPALRGNKAVLTVMQEQPRIWTAREVHEELERRGWVSQNVAHPRRGTEAALNRLYRSKKVERLGRGRYRAVA